MKDDHLDHNFKPSLIELRTCGTNAMGCALYAGPFLVFNLLYLAFNVQSLVFLAFFVTHKGVA